MTKARAKYLIAKKAKTIKTLTDKISTIKAEIVTLKAIK